jgi:hypothetical protein
MATVSITGAALAAAHYTFPDPRGWWGILYVEAFGADGATYHHRHGFHLVHGRAAARTLLERVKAAGAIDPAHWQRCAPSDGAAA